MKLVSANIRGVELYARRSLDFDIQSLTNVSIDENGISSPFRTDSHIILCKNTPRHDNYEILLKVRTPNFKTASDRIWIIRENANSVTSGLLCLWQPIYQGKTRALYYGSWDDRDRQLLYINNCPLDTMNDNWYYVKIVRKDNFFSTVISLEDGTIMGEQSFTAPDSSIIRSGATTWNLFRWSQNSAYIAEGAQIDFKNSYFQVN